MAEDVFGIVGSVIAGAYHVEKVVAEGGFGVVYRAHHSGFRAPVALKCLKIPGHLGTEHQETFLEQFRAEAELLFRLSASIPTVVRPLHVDAVTTADGSFVPFMALEWLEGETLDAIMERRRSEGLRPLGVKKLVRMLTPVARALERAHNFNGPDGPISIVHRDLKPENIFVAKVAGEEVVKILDFGIGKAKSVASQVAGRASQTQAGFSSFTPAYGAPEQWVPKRFGQTGPWTDVWGLALTIVEVMAGRPIIDGDQAAMMGTALDPTRRPTPRNEGVEVDDAVEAVFVKALAVDPRERYAHAGQFWDELCQALGLSDDARPRHSRAPGRDFRSEGGPVPRTERVDVVGSSPPAAAAASREAETIAAAEIEAPAPVIPDLAPDLTLEPPVSGQRHTSPRPAAPSIQALDFDDEPAAMDLDLDLGGEERPMARRSYTDIRAQSGSGAGWQAAPASGNGRSTGPRQTPASGAGWSPPSDPGPSPSGPAWSPPPSARSSAPPAVPGIPPASAIPTGPVGVAPPHSVPAPGVRATPAPAEKDESLVMRLLPGMVLLVLSVVITLGGQAYAESSGQVFTMGPLTTGRVGAGLMVLGILAVIYKLLPKSR